jgi:transcriptional regulator with XRE-family HTH domain
MVGRVSTNDKPAKAAKSTGRPLGATGETVRKNIRDIRDRKGISAPELSSRLKELDRAIPPLGIHRIESGDRRVDADDLMAFAVALGVSPITLLMPEASSEESPVTITGEELELHAGRVWTWLTAFDTLPQTPTQVKLMGVFFRSMFGAYAWPAWIQAEDARTSRAKIDRMLGHADEDDNGDD